MTTPSPLDACLSELRHYGFHPEQEQIDGIRVRLSWRMGGQGFSYVTTKRSSDQTAWKNARADIRRLCKPYAPAGKQLVSDEAALPRIDTDRILAAIEAQAAEVKALSELVQELLLKAASQTGTPSTPAAAPAAPAKRALDAEAINAEILDIVEYNMPKAIREIHSAMRTQVSVSYLATRLRTLVEIGKVRMPARGFYLKNNVQLLRSGQEVK